MRVASRPQCFALLGAAARRLIQRSELLRPPSSAPRCTFYRRVGDCSPFRTESRFAPQLEPDETLPTIPNHEAGGKAPNGLKSEQRTPSSADQGRAALKRLEHSVTTKHCYIPYIEEIGGRSAGAARAEQL